MNLNQPTLMQFENIRKLSNTIPPEGSNSFYAIGNGRINLLTLSTNPDLPRFDLTIQQGDVNTGTGNFIINGNETDNSSPYNTMTIDGVDPTLHVTEKLTVSMSTITVRDRLELMEGSEFVVRNNSSVHFYPDSTFTINDKTTITVEPGSTIKIYGNIIVDLNRVDALLDMEGVIIDSAAVISVRGLDQLGKRLYSLTDYDADLRKKVINIYTQGESNTEYGRIGYTWTGGSPLTSSQLIRMSVLWGEVALGDFKLSVLGTPETEIENLQMISELQVKEKTTLYISEYFKENRYIHPNLYLGIVMENNKIPANLDIDGTVIVDGTNSRITVDRGATIHINEGGSIYLQNQASILCTNNEQDVPLFFIDGTLIIDDVNQIYTFSHDNIEFGENGKLIVLNPDNGDHRLLWTTPNGILETDLYRLFQDRINHVEYHISNNTGIGIDQYYDYYATGMTKWFGDRRIEKAIHDGILVWHNGGFIELDHDIVPWATLDSTLLKASRLFKSYGSFDSDKLQEVVDRLRYAGSGNIVFRFIEGDEYSEVLMNLEDIEVQTVLNHPATKTYNVTTSNDGQIYLKAKVNTADAEHIITPESRVVQVVNKKAYFPLE
ncbi:MAG: flagellin [Lachnospiraceae bacterium]|nr:flagellin [Lachnospiraceae bacterium]MCM1232022.1 flagellin [Ruminococcus flavefaciens]